MAEGDTLQGVGCDITRGRATESLDARTRSVTDRQVETGTYLQAVFGQFWRCARRYELASALWNAVVSTLAEGSVVNNVVHVPK